MRLQPTRRNLQRQSVCSVQRRWWRCGGAKHADAVEVICVRPPKRSRSACYAFTGEVKQEKCTVGKPTFYRQAEMTLPEAYDFAAEIMVNNMLANDAEEGINAFIEKRPAIWKDGV